MLHSALDADQYRIGFQGNIAVRILVLFADGARFGELIVCANPPTITRQLMTVPSRVGVFHEIISGALWILWIERDKGSCCGKSLNRLVGGTVPTASYESHNRGYRQGCCCSRRCSLRR